DVAPFGVLGQACGQVGDSAACGVCHAVVQVPSRRVIPSRASPVLIPMCTFTGSMSATSSRFHCLISMAALTVLPAFFRESSSLNIIMKPSPAVSLILPWERRLHAR
ncbi:MAG: hypothetical protein K9K82_05775, partial [Desulfobacteraceae bacterium]|nr:hypothetical protein [Desulfobacteraceae bacterium]